MKNIDPTQVITGRNRGIVLDVIVFIINLILMSDLSTRLNDLIGIGPGRTDARAIGTMATYCALACILPATGAFLKYISGSQKHTPHFYRKTWGKQFMSMMIIVLIFQFLSQAVFFIAEYNYQGKLLTMIGGSGTVSLLLKLLLALCVIGIVLNPFIVRLNFIKNRIKLLSGIPRGLVEFLGDICLFLNMILFQIFWGVFMSDLTQDWGGVLERVLALAITSLLLYFPPRFIYLADDGHRPIAWVTMILANMPIIIRIIIAD